MGGSRGGGVLRVGYLGFTIRIMHLFSGNLVMRCKLFQL
jgi:hypothetical protein